MNRYPVYVISKGRPGAKALTARFLRNDGVDFDLVVEPSEADAYRDDYPDEVHVAPENFSERGQGSIPVRNYVWEDAARRGAERHWILDDNIGMIRRSYRGRRIPCAAGPAFAAVEDLADRYENAVVAGLNYQMFGIPGIAPFFVNVHVYSCLLIETAIPYRWRGRYNEDTDLCLQVLAGGLCTILVNVFLIDKKRTGTMTGGNTDDLYAGDGRLRMARDLERAWPRTVTVDRRWQRPQHVIRKNWRAFDTPLKLKDGVDLSALPRVDEYGMTLTAVKPVASPSLRRVRDNYRRRNR